MFRVQISDFTLNNLYFFILSLELGVNCYKFFTVTKLNLYFLNYILVLKEELRNLKL